MIPSRLRRAIRLSTAMGQFSVSDMMSASPSPPPDVVEANQLADSVVSWGRTDARANLLRVERELCRT